MDFALIFKVYVAILHLNIGVKYILSNLYYRASGIKVDRSSLQVFSFSVILSWATLICHLSLSSSHVFDE